MALQPVKEPGLAELPLIADAMVAAGLPHGAGLDDMARIEDTSPSVREAVDEDGRPQVGLLDVVANLCEKQLVMLADHRLNCLMLLQTCERSSW